MSSVVHTSGGTRHDPQLAELISQMEEMKADYEKQLAAVEDINAQLVDEQNDLRAQLEEREDHIARLEARGREQAEQNARLQEELKKQAEENAKLQDQLRAQQKAGKEAIEHVQQLQA